MSPTTFLRILLGALCFQACASLLVQPRFAMQSAGPRALRSGVTMQFGGGEPERKGLTRENEPDEFFSTNMDDMTDAEKLRSPVVIGGLALLLAPFIAGAIALAYYR